MSTWVRIASIADMPERGVVAAEAEGEKIVLVATGDGAYYALRDRCSHADFPLSDGEIIDGNRLECQYHGAKFDIPSGRAVALPAIRPVKTFELKVDGDDILVALE